VKFLELEDFTKQGEIMFSRSVSEKFRFHLRERNKLIKVTLSASRPKYIQNATLKSHMPKNYGLTTKITTPVLSGNDGSKAKLINEFSRILLAAKSIPPPKLHFCLTN
jgi:hypothetical protein